MKLTNEQAVKMSDAYQQFLKEHRERYGALPWHSKLWIHLKRHYALYRWRFGECVAVLRGYRD